jgi:P4 family phage/plasmid primase-like protien
MFVLFGPRNTGKSTLISILMGLVPEYATCSVPPEEWNHQYNRAHLDGKLLNVVTELGGGRIVGGDHLKRIVSGEMVSARHPHGKTFHFTAAAFHLFAANELPRVTDRTTAFERRVLALSFDRSLEPGEIDGDFMARIEAERAGIVNWAAEGAIRLLERGRFTIPRGHLEAVLTMQFGQDPVEHFVHLCVERAPDSKVSTADLRNALKAFGDDRGFEMSHARSLAGRLKEVHGAERFKVQGRPHYRGIRLKAAPSA